MSSVDIHNLLALRRHLCIAHHIPGRVRLRIGAALYGQALALDRDGLSILLDRVGGIHDIHLNPAAASLIILYDPGMFPPDHWEILVAGRDEDAARLFGEVAIAQESHLAGVRL